MPYPCSIRLPHRVQQVTDIADLIGYTPLIRLRKITAHLPPTIEIYGKAEWFNPGGSVKDRPAWNIVRVALERGELTPNKRLLDATSGNTGIAFAMLGAALGFGVTLCMPANVTPERKRILQAYGAEVILTDPLESSDGAIRMARQLYAQNPERYFYADQYNNPANWQAHYETTGVEIWHQTEGRITHFVAGLGTTGTFVGTGRRLRTYNPQIKLIALQPDSPFHGLEGLKHLETAIVPGIYDPTLADETLFISTEDAYRMVRRLAREEGLLVGISSGAAVVGALKVAERIAQSENPQAVIVTILCDSADKYLSERLWEEAP
ncbi:MAG: cysteine synthase [Fimbriimonadales bacterium]|jgi:cysteine synthase B|nr:cysteine synthase [Fimbriimonadales bacterium]GBC90705.1 Cysteine synthase B [bacterium HR14]CUU10039.1 cysteine synthase [Armatimonadetes bacterium GBS]CUU34759.1 cysteine synthase [Armatimonadetes bacterium GXS]